MLAIGSPVLTKTRNGALRKDSEPRKSCFKAEFNVLVLIQV